MELALYFKGFQDLDRDIQGFKVSTGLQSAFRLLYNDVGSQVFRVLLDPWHNVMHFSRTAIEYTSPHKPAPMRDTVLRARRSCSMENNANWRSFTLLLNCRFSWQSRGLERRGLWLLALMMPDNSMMLF
jgi:hypothetical protein